MKGFVHLHVHSHYSLLDGLPTIDRLIENVARKNMKAVALTDHGVMHGAIEFYQKAKKAGIKPIIGCEAYLARNGMEMKRARVDDRPYHIILLAKNLTGYQNLIKITTAAHLRGYYYRPRVDHEFLAKHAEGIIATSACLQGEIAQAIIAGNADKAEQAALRYQEIFGKDNFYLEMQHHPSVPHQMEINQQLAIMSKKLGIPLVATNDVHYLEEEDAEAQDILLCLQTKRKKSDKDRMSYLGENFSLRTPDEMARLFHEHPEALENSVKIAERCTVEIELGKLTLPHFTVPNGKSADAYLQELCEKGLSKRYPGKARDEQLQERLAYELSVIERTGFAPYFLIVHDFVAWAKTRNIVVGPGRGSAAGSIVSYLLNITNIDPIQYDLLFERFLNPDRISMPDIDLDFTDTRRDEVIRYVEEKYGKDHVAQIITFGTMAARVVVRDVGRVLDYPYAYCDKIAKLIPMFTTLDKALATIPEMKEIYEHDANGRKLLDQAKKLEGVVRHASTHACGVVITQKPLDEYVPVQYAAQDERIIITQYSLHAIEDLGLLKMDFLGLKNLTILENTIEIIEKTHGKKIDIDTISLNDERTFALLQAGKTTGVFQLESSGMKRYLSQLKPTSLEDIIAMVSLYRPGPMEFIPDFIAGKHKRREMSYVHPALKPILEKTYGVIVYQEQIMEIARELAGFTYAEADVLRKAVGKKIAKLLKEQKDKFIDGCVKNKIPRTTAEKIFKFIEPFARYGFNRAHAACYALIAYQTAYFKANYPNEFMASLLTSDYGDMDRIAIEVNECEDMGIRVLPPDINESFSTFTSVFDQEKKIPVNTIRFGLMAIKNIGTNIAKEIIRERKANGPYNSLEDFLTRIKSKDMNKKSLESLIKSGALAQFGEQNELLENLDVLLAHVKNSQKAVDSNQVSLFAHTPVSHAPRLKLRQTDPASKFEMLRWEKEYLGLYISDHPLQEYAEALKQTVTPIAEIRHQAGTMRPLKIAGIITQIQRIITRSNEPMLFVKLEDTSSRIEVLVFPSILKENPSLWLEDALVIIEGKLSDKDGEIKVIANAARPLDLQTMRTHQQTDVTNTITVHLRENVGQDLMARLKAMFVEHPGPYKVRLKIDRDQSSRLIATNFSIDEACIQSVKKLLGEESLLASNGRSV